MGLQRRDRAFADQSISNPAMKPSRGHVVQNTSIRSGIDPSAGHLGQELFHDPLAMDLESASVLCVSVFDDGLR